MIIYEQRRLIETGLIRECADGPCGPLVFGPIEGHDAVVTAGNECTFVVDRSLHERGVVVAGQLFESEALLEMTDADIAQTREVRASGCTRL